MSNALSIQPSVTRDSILLNHGFIPYVNFLDNLPFNNNQISIEDASFVYGLCKNLESIGYSVHPSSFEAFANIDEADRENFYTKLAASLKAYKGVTQNINVIFPNFPKQVEYLSEDELWLNRIVHGLFVDENGDRAVIPYEKEVRLPFYEKNDLTYLKSATRQDFEKIFTDALSSPSPFNESRKGEILWFVTNYPGYEKLIPQNIPSRENAITLAGYMIDSGKNYDDVSYLCKNTTDVLRLAAVLNGESAALTSKPNFKNMSTHNKKVLINFMDKHNNAQEMKKYKAMWLDLGKQLRIGSKMYAKYKNAQQSFDLLRNFTVRSSRADLEQAIEDKDVLLVSNILRYKFTAEYARRFDFLLRNCQSKGEINTILEDFSYSIKKSSSKQLLELLQFYKQKTDTTLENLGLNNQRVFLPKGGSSFYVKEDKNILKPSKNICDRISAIISDELEDRYKQKAHLGNVYINNDIKGFAAPIKLRGSSDGFKSTTRGSRIPISEDKRYTRFFIHWCNAKRKDYESSVDIDLSSTFFDENLKPLSRINFGNIKNNEYKAYHSGDFRDAPSSKGGAYEFIDVDLEHLKKMGVKYVSCEVYSYSGTPYCELPECFVGYETISDPEAGELIEPSAIKAKIDLNNSNDEAARHALPFVIDVENKELVWCDIYSRAGLEFSTSERNTNRNIYNIASSLVSPLSLKEVVDLSIKNRCNLLDEEDLIKANVVICENPDVYKDIKFENEVQFITPYDLDTISSMFINDEPEPTNDKDLQKELLANDIFNDIQQNKLNEVNIESSDFIPEEIDEYDDIDEGYEL